MEPITSMNDVDSIVRKSKLYRDDFYREELREELRLAIAWLKAQLKLAYTPRDHGEA